MRYGNTIATLKHVSKVGIVFGIITLTIFILAPKNDDLSVSKAVMSAVGVSLCVASIVPFLVFITTLLNIEIQDRVVSLLFCYKLKISPRPVDTITSIEIGRLLLTIRFNDGTSIRTLGMYIPEYYRLVKDIRGLREKPLQVKSNWLRIN